VFDVVVVGAGPSGSTASYILAREGLRVALVEKAKLPRQKACGGGLTPKTVALLRELGLLSESVPMNACDALRVFYRWRHLFDINGARVFITKRDIFDYSLAKRAAEAGAALFERTSVTGIKELGGSIKVVTESGSTLSAEVVVGADGVYSTVAKALGRKWRKRDLSIAAVTLLSLQENTNLEKSVCELHFGITRYGYCWVFPVSDAGGVFNVGCGTTLDYSKLLLEAFQRFTRRFNLNYRPDARVHLIPTPSKFKRELFGTGRVLLVGDAAGLVDPWFGEGIYYAVKSAFYASRAILDVWGREDILDSYNHFLAEHILPDLNYARVFRRVFYLRVGTMLRIIGDSKRLKQALINLLEGEVRYRDLPKYLTPCLGRFLR